MAEYIEREAFLDARRKLYCADCAHRKGMKNGKFKVLYEIGDAPCRACGINDVLEDVEDFPAADVVPVVHGRWIKDCDRVMGDGWTYTQRHCSECGGQSVECVNYCQFCGARMDGDGDV